MIDVAVAMATEREPSPHRAPPQLLGPGDRVERQAHGLAHSEHASGAPRTTADHPSLAPARPPVGLVPRMRLRKRSRGP